MELFVLLVARIEGHAFRRPLVGLLVTLAALACSCASILGIDALEKVEDPPPADGSAPFDAQAEAAQADASDASDTGAPLVDASVPDGMVFVDASTPFYIDPTEVTWEAYLAFSAQGLAKDATPGGGAVSCSPDHVPSIAPPPPAERNMPVVGVDYCDARAFCAWNGKRLCRKLDGSPPTSGSPVGGELHAACAFPQPPPQTECFDAGGKVEPVASRAGCVGGAVGVYDLLGNVEEWGDGIYQSTWAPLFGGFTTANPFRCDTSHGAVPSSRAPTIGFRCCRDTP